MDITTLHKVNSDVTSVPTVNACTPNIVAGAIFAEGSSMIVVRLGARSLLMINYVSMSKILVIFQSVTLVHVERCSMIVKETGLSQAGEDFVSTPAIHTIAFHKLE